MKGRMEAALFSWYFSCSFVFLISFKRHIFLVIHITIYIRDYCKQPNHNQCNPELCYLSFSTISTTKKGPSAIEKVTCYNIKHLNNKLTFLIQYGQNTLNIYFMKPFPSV